MALHRLNRAVLGAISLLSACGNQANPSQPSRQPVVEVTSATTATADVDARATLALKQVLLTNFPQNSAGNLVEAGLIRDGFGCGPNPAAPTERACLKANREGACEINTIIRTTPYAPEKAQVIKICEVASPEAK
jgi:hypothetical protein